LTDLNGELATPKSVLIWPALIWAGVNLDLRANQSRMATRHTEDAR